MGGMIIGSSCGRNDESDLLPTLVEGATIAIVVILFIMFMRIGFMFLGE